MNKSYECAIHLPRVPLRQARAMSRAGGCGSEFLGAWPENSADVRQSDWRRTWLAAKTWELVWLHCTHPESPRFCNVSCAPVLGHAGLCNVSGALILEYLSCAMFPIHLPWATKLLPNQLKKGSIL